MPRIPCFIPFSDNILVVFKVRQKIEKKLFHLFWPFLEEKGKLFTQYILYFAGFPQGLEIMVNLESH